MLNNWYCFDDGEVIDAFWYYDKCKIAPKDKIIDDILYDKGYREYSVEELNAAADAITEYLSNPENVIRAYEVTVGAAFTNLATTIESFDLKEYYKLHLTDKPITKQNAKDWLKEFIEGEYTEFGLVPDSQGDNFGRYEYRFGNNGHIECRKSGNDSEDAWEELSDSDDEIYKLFVVYVDDNTEVLAELWRNEVLAEYCNGSRKSQNNVIVIDTETTGLVAGSDELLQVSIINADNEVLFNSYIRPTYTQAWDSAQAVNGISPEMVADAPTIDDVRKQIQSIFDNANVICGYNTQFDLGFLQAAGITVRDDVSVVDVMRDFAPIYGEWNSEKQDFKWQKLIKCAEYFNYDWGTDTAHDSLADCRATLYCWKALNNLAKTNDNNNYFMEVNLNELEAVRNSGIDCGVTSKSDGSYILMVAQKDKDKVLDIIRKSGLRL